MPTKTSQRCKYGVKKDGGCKKKPGARKGSSKSRSRKAM